MIRIKELELFHFSKHPKSCWKFNEKLKNFFTQFWMSINCWKPMEPQSRVNILYSQFKFEYRDDEWITTKSTRLGRTKTSMSGLISFVKKLVKYQRIWEVCKQVNMKLPHTWNYPIHEITPYMTSPLLSRITWHWSGEGHVSSKWEERRSHRF